MKFITINGRVLDYDKYLDECKTVNRLVEIDVKQLLLKYGFRKAAGGFYNEDLDLLVDVKVRKKGKNVFV